MNNKTDEENKTKKTRSKREPPVVLHFDHPDGFNPTDKIYKACCCHAKTFTLIMGILEIFVISFLLVAVLPDVTTRICDKLNNETDFSEPLINFDLNNIKNVTYVSSILCNNNTFYFAWTFAQIVSIICMFYGIKVNRFWLFFPHFFFRITSIIVIGTVESWIIYRAINDSEGPVGYVTTIILFTVGGIVTLYATWIEVRCCCFVKRSRDTGFSISVARPMINATISLSDNLPEPVEEPEPRRRLPPLRHSRQQYIVQDDPPPPGNPNATKD